MIHPLNKNPAECIPFFRAKHNKNISQQNAPIQGGLLPTLEGGYFKGQGDSVRSRNVTLWLIGVS